MSEKRPLAMAAGVKDFVLATADGQDVSVVKAHEVFRKTDGAPVLLCNRSLMNYKGIGLNIIGLNIL